MTVLKGDLAIRQSKALIRTFKQMKDYITQDPLLPGSSNIERLSLQISENTRDISEIKEAMITKEDLTKVIQSFSLPDKGIEYVIYAGQTFEADVAYADIYSKAKKKLYIVDKCSCKRKHHHFQRQSDEYSSLIRVSSIPSGISKCKIVLSKNRR